MEWIFGIMGFMVMGIVMTMVWILRSTRNVHRNSSNTSSSQPYSHHDPFLHHHLHSQHHWSTNNCHEDDQPRNPANFGDLSSGGGDSGGSDGGGGDSGGGGDGGGGGGGGD